MPEGKLKNITIMILGGFIWGVIGRGKDPHPSTEQLRFRLFDNLLHTRTAEINKPLPRFRGNGEITPTDRTLLIERIKRPGGRRYVLVLQDEDTAAETAGVLEKAEAGQINKIVIVGSPVLLSEPTDPGGHTARKNIAIAHEGIENLPRGIYIVQKGQRLPWREAMSVAH